MKTSIDRIAENADVLTRLDKVRMSRPERRHAIASLRDGELIAEGLLRASADLRALFGIAEHAATGLAHGIKTMFAKPAKH